MNCFSKKILLFSLWAWAACHLVCMDLPPHDSGVGFSTRDCVAAEACADHDQSSVLMSDLDVTGDEDSSLDVLVQRFENIHENERDIKGVMLLMVLQEHTLETYFAEKIAAADGSDTCGFDDRLKTLLSFERATFNRLSTTAQALWSSFEESFAHKESRFNFRSIRALFDERTRFRDTCFTYLGKIFSIFEDEAFSLDFFTFLADDGEHIFKNSFLEMIKRRGRDSTEIENLRINLRHLESLRTLEERTAFRVKKISSMAKNFQKMPLWTECSSIYYLDSEIIHSTDFGFYSYFDCAYKKIDNGHIPVSQALREKLNEIRPHFESFSQATAFMARFCDLLPTVIQKAYIDASYFRSGYRMLYEKLCSFLPRPSQRIVDTVHFPVDRAMLLPRRIFLLHEAPEDVCRFCLSALSRLILLKETAAQDCMTSDRLKRFVSYSSTPSVFLDYLLGSLLLLQGDIDGAFSGESIEAALGDDAIFDSACFDVYHALIDFGLWKDGIADEFLDNMFCIRFNIDIDSLRAEIEQYRKLKEESAAKRSTVVRERLALRAQERSAAIELEKRCVQLDGYQVICQKIDSFLARYSSYPRDLFLYKQIFLLDMELIPVFKYYVKVLQEKISIFERKKDLKEKRAKASKVSDEPRRKHKSKKTRALKRHKKKHDDGTSPIDDCAAAVVADVALPDVHDDVVAAETEPITDDGLLVRASDEGPADNPVQKVFGTAIPVQPSVSLEHRTFETLIIPRRDDSQRAVTIVLFEDAQLDAHEDFLRYPFVRKASDDLWHTEAIDAAISVLKRGFGVVCTKDSIRTYNELFNDTQQVHLRTGQCAVVIEAKIGNYSARRLFQTEEQVAFWRGDKPVRYRRDIHSGAFVFIFDTSSGLCFHQCFHEFKESYRYTHSDVVGEA